MNTTPLFSKRKINSQCQNSLISILHNNNDNVLSKFGDNKNLQQYKAVSSLKNDYLIKNKASNCDINMNILNNPFISTKFKNKLDGFASLSPNTTYSIKNKYQEKIASGEKNRENSPIGRNIYVDEVVPVIQYMLSDSAASMTGQNIVISGGL